MRAISEDDFSRRLADVVVASPFDFALSAQRGLKLDLGEGNPRLNGVNTADPAAFSAFIAGELAAAVADYAAGGYAEDRALYRMSRLFDGADEPRTVHLGIDLWTAAGTPVHTVVGGTVHSFQDNATFGDYGPTVVLTHEVDGLYFHTLYGHLARRSLSGLAVGQVMTVGERLGWLGTPDENLGWPPHLHFQIVRDLGGARGDFPGVCRASERARWLANSPDPNLLLRLPPLVRL